MWFDYKGKRPLTIRESAYAGSLVSRFSRLASEVSAPRREASGSTHQECGKREAEDQSGGCNKSSKPYAPVLTRDEQESRDQQERQREEQERFELIKEETQSDFDLKSQIECKQ